MKTLLSAVLMIAVSAWGQPPQKQSDRTCVIVKEWKDARDNQRQSLTPASCNKPHKPKPSVKPDGNVQDYGVFSWPRDPPKPPVKQDRNRTCISPQDDKNTDCILLFREQVTVVDPCDDFACTKPVEELDCTNEDEASVCTRTRMSPDKAAVPVEPIASDFFDMHWYGAEGREPQCPDGMPCLFVHVTSNPLASRVDAFDGSLVVKLSDSEYSHLQQLRASVIEEEKRLAVKYGADMGGGCAWNGSGFTMCDQIYRPADHYEYKGQFLLITKEGR